VPCDEVVCPVERSPWDAAERAADGSGEGHRAEELDTTCAASDDGAVGHREMPGRKALLLVHSLEQRCRLGRAHRQERELVVSVHPCDGTRREAAEASAGVVEQYGPSSH
jgi:hypothetical protein